MEKFVWSCTKFLAALLCAFCPSTLLVWRTGCLGYVSFIGGLFCAVWIYSMKFFPVLHKEDELGARPHNVERCVLAS